MFSAFPCSKLKWMAFIQDARIFLLDYMKWRIVVNSCKNGGRTRKQLRCEGPTHRTLVMREQWSSHHLQLVFLHFSSRLPLLRVFPLDLTFFQLPSLGFRVLLSPERLRYFFACLQPSGLIGHYLCIEQWAEHWVRVVRAAYPMHGRGKLQSPDPPELGLKHNP